MPSLSPATLPERGAAILIAGASGRQLAAAARRAGYRPLVADFYGDLDTLDFCEAAQVADRGLEFGFTQDNLFPLLDSLAANGAPCGFVYGAGFEDRTRLLEAIGGRWPLLGNLPDVVRRVKDPFQLAELCSALSIAHPEVSAQLPCDSADWLAKSAGGSGGCHVAPAVSSNGKDKNVYFQRFAKGEPASILFLADGAKAQAVGVSRQWTSPRPGEPYRFGGSLRPAGLPAAAEERMREAAETVTAACGLRGLNSIDFLAEERAITLIEINPRPGATLDIFEHPQGLLFEAHLRACLGELPEAPLRFSGAAAASIAYARRKIDSMPALDWPSWAADRQKPKTTLCQHDPVCTVKARAATPSRARALVNQRMDSILWTIEQFQNKNETYRKEAHLEHQ
jgi:predicted ATP-grasp superfamily ATP-dependent carboligase